MSSPLLMLQLLRTVSAQKVLVLAYPICVAMSLAFRNLHFTDMTLDILSIPDKCLDELEFMHISPMKGNNGH